MASTTPAPAARESVLDEYRSSPGLWLALLGQEAMRRLRAAHTAHDLKPRQFEILGLLHDHGALPQGELLRIMDVDPSILVTLLKPLELAKLVARVRDPQDRRRHVISLTSAGEKRLDRASSSQKETEDELFAALTADQREQLRSLLLVLRDGLAAEGGCSAAPALRSGK